MILAELTGSIAAHPRGPHRPNARAFLFLSLGLLILSFGWDRIQCFPFSPNCLKFWPLLLPFLSGFLSRYQLSFGSANLKHLGHKRLRLLTLLFATLILFPPSLLTFFIFPPQDHALAFGDLAWPLLNTVVFGVLLTETCNTANDDPDHAFSTFKDSHREFLLTFVCTLVLELFYFPELSLWGLLLSGFLLYLGVRDLDPHDEGFLGDVVMKPVRHVLSERKSRKIALFLLINAGYMVVEFAAGFMSNSLGLISDACHMLFDCAALAIGLYASYISRLPANNHYNFGRGRFEVLSGYANAVFLVLVGALIVVESFERILDPQEISTNSLLVVSVGGLLVNVVGLIFFHEEHHHAHGHGCEHGHHHHHHHHDHSGHETKHLEDTSHVHQEHGHHGHHHIDHNMEGIFLHVLADTMGSVGVVISTLLIKYKGWLVADPACSIFISILIVSSVIPLLKNSAEVLLQRVPRMHEHNLKDALTSVLKIRGVYGIQKFHSWSFTNTDVVGTMHLHVSMDTDKISAKSQVLHLLHDAGIKDVTLQVESVG
uniref:Zinc transporter 5 n=1 Tax=Cajanus cajan TaxID=3821 RepID=A0A151SDR8_CAJCA|nr:Zinc transporter 5 [Cajanus cajan]